MKDNKRVTLTFILFNLMIAAVLLVHQYSFLYFDSDLYFILNEGRKIWESGIQYYNNQNVVEGLATVVQQWLYAAMCYGVYSIGGEAGMYVLCVLMVAGVALAFSLLAKVKGVPKYNAWAIIVMFIALSVNFVSCRPTMFTVTLLILQVTAVEYYKSTGKKGVLWVLPLLTLIEINCHAALWIMHFLFLLPYVVPSISINGIQKKDYKVTPILIVSLVMAVTLFINPYGVDGILYLFNSYNDKLKGIGILELEAPALNNQFGFIAIIGIILLWESLRRCMPAEYCYLVAGTLVLGCSHIRHLIYLLLAVSILVVEIAKKTYKPLEKVCKASSGIINALIIVITCVAVFNSLQVTRGVQDTNRTPIKAVEYLNEHATKDVDIFTEFNSGAFLAWNGYKYFIDARPELYFKSINGKCDVYDECDELTNCDSDETYEKYKIKYDFDYFIVLKVEHNGAVSKPPLGIFLDHDDDYEEVLNTDEYVLYEKVAK